MRTLDLGLAGWTSTAQITATGCGAGSCPAAAGAWAEVPTSGGVLRSVLTAPPSHSGQAVVTWRSPVFVVPPIAGLASFTIAMAASHAWTAGPDAVPTYTVRLLDTATGVFDTVVNSIPVPTPEAGWTTSPAVVLPPSALETGSAKRLEITIRFVISAATGDTTVDLDRPTFALHAPAAEDVSVATSAVSAPGLLAPAPGATAPASDSTPPARGDGIPNTPPGAPAPACGVAEDVAVIGAAGRGRRLTIAGTAIEPAGTDVDLLSVDGWLLGHAAVTASGHFAADLPEPRGSAGTTKVFARLGDGRRSNDVAVARRNVLRAVRMTADGLVVEGTVAPRVVRRGSVGIDLELPGPKGCDRPIVVHASRVVVHRASGAYLATVTRSALRAAGHGSAPVSLSEPAFVRSRVTSQGHGFPAEIVRSQMIFGPKSDRRGT